MSIIRSIFLVVSCIVLGACTPSCTRQADNAEYWSTTSFQNTTLRFGLKASETFRVDLGTEPPTLDWSKSSDTTSSYVQQQIMEGLVEFDLTDPNFPVKPGLATSWESSNNGLRWTFKLREGVKWTDGVELTAQHFVDGWERLLNPATASPYAYYLFFVPNAQSYNKGDLKDFAQVGVKAVDDLTFQVDLTSPRSYLPSMLTHHAAYPIRKDVVARHGDDKWTEPENIVTLGAYKLMRWEHDEILHLERNEDYYGEAPDRIRHLLFYIIREPSTGLSMYDRHDLDVLTQLPTARIQILKQREDFKSGPNIGIYYFGFNTKKAPFDNLQFRQAIAHAVDRQEVVMAIGNSGPVPTTNFIPSGLMGL